MSCAQFLTFVVRFYLFLEHHIGPYSNILGCTILVFPISLICLELQSNQFKINVFVEVSEDIE